MKSPTAALLVTAILLLGVPARAPAAGMRIAQLDTTARARAHFRKGVELYRQARYREAIAEFEAAYRLHPHGVIYFNIAQCDEKLGDIPAALQAYHNYLREVPNAEDRATVHAAMANLEARLSATGVQQLLVYSDPSGAELLVDGQSRGRTPMALVLPHGSHSVTLLKEGYRSTTRQVLLSPQASLELDVPLQRLAPGEVNALPPPSQPMPPTAAAPAPPAGSTPSQALAPPVAPPRAAPHRRLWSWVAAGASAAVLATGLYYGISAHSAERDYLAGKGDPNALKSKSQSDAKTANILYGVGGALGLGAGALFFVEGRF